MGEAYNPVQLVRLLSCMLALRRWFHPVGVVMLSSVGATAILKAISTGLRFNYGNGEWAFASISRHLLVTLIINTMLATLLFFALGRK